MSELSVSVRARCESCETTYRVANADRTYICKSCRGTVRVVVDGGDDSAPAEPAVGARNVTCIECQAINPAGLHFCAECGTSLPDTKPVPGNELVHRLREEAADALKRVSTGFQVLTWTYQVAAVGYAIATFFAVQALADPEVPTEGGVAIVVLTTLLSVLFGTAALHAQFKPFVWTVAIAVATTAVTTIHLFGPNPFGLAVWASGAWALVAFGLLVPTFWFRKQIARHKDLYILHHTNNEIRRALRGRPAAERHERLLGVMHRAARRNWARSATMACLVVVASVAGTMFYLHKRPAPLQPALAKFEQAWGSGKIMSVVDVLEGNQRPLAKRILSGAVTGHGWGERLPPLGDSRVEHSGGGATVSYDVADLSLSTHWTRIDNEWELDQVAIPLPDYRPTIERFVATWAGSDLDKIVEFFEPDSRPEMLEKLKGELAKGGWETVPPILVTELTEQDETHVGAVHACANGRLTIRWYYDVNGAWWIGNLKLPRR